MSLPCPNDDPTEEGRLLGRGPQGVEISEGAQEAGAVGHYTRPKEVKLDSNERPDIVDLSGTEVVKSTKDDHLNSLQAGEAAETGTDSIQDTKPDEVDLSGSQDVRQLSHHISVTNTKTTNEPLGPPLDKDKGGSSKYSARDELQETVPFSGPSSLQSSPRTAVESRAGEEASPYLGRQGTGKKEADLVNLSKAKEEDSQSEIQSIMEQFDEPTYAPENEDFNSRQNAIVGNTDSTPWQYPPRLSSLDGRSQQSLVLESTMSNFHISPISSHLPIKGEPQERNENDSAGVSADPSSNARPTRPGSQSFGSPLSPRSSMSLHKALPPEPDPEPDLPFDFHRFLDQLRHRTADPVAKFLRSFLIEFSKKQWMVYEQVKIISDFQLFITNKMAQCDVWRDISDAEFDNAKEGMEKLVMNRLYTQTFSPAIDPPTPLINVKGKIKAPEKSITPGRRGQHQEDIERDDVLAQKVQIYGWVKEVHLDIPPIGERGRRFLNLARQELIKIKSYRAPRDKVICILNCCKVIFGLLRDSKSGDTSADSFVPLLILVVLQANPDHLVSNVQYIMRFRNQDKLAGEAGYYLSSLTGAIQFIENLDRTALTISDAEFEINVEAAVSAIAEKHEEEQPLKNSNTIKPPSAMFTALSEKAELSRPELSPRNSHDTEWHPRRSADGVNGSEDASEEKAAVTGLLRTIKKPLSSIGRIFSEDASTQGTLQPQQNVRLQEVQANVPPETPLRLSPAVLQPSRGTPQQGRRSHDLGDKERMRSPEYTANEAAARQASAEVAEASRIQRAEHNDIVETLAGMFPGLDRDVIDDVVREKQGRVGLAVDACLALSS